MRIGRYRRELSVAATYAALLLVMAVANRDFFKPEQLRATAVGAAPVLIVALGMTLVVISRNIDISVGSQFSVCGVVAGLLAREGLPMPLVGLGTVLAGGGLGAVNGALVAGLGLPSIVVTLATLVVLRESLRWGREGTFVRGLPADFQWFGAGQAVGPWVVIGLALLVFAAFAWSAHNLAAGRAVYATGSDPEAARLAGVRPKRVVFGVFVVMGMLSGLAGLLNAVRFVDVDPNSGTGLELQAIAAVVVGGAAVSGGRGTMLGTLAGVLLLGSVGTALVFLHVQPQWEKAVQGLVILVAVASDAVGREGR